MSLSCDVTRDLLPLYHDGVCSDESRALVEAHVALCPGCTELLKELRGELELSHGEPDDASVLKKLEKNVQRGRKRAWVRGIAAALAAVLTVFAGVYLWWYADVRCYYQRFAQGHEPVLNNSVDAYGSTMVLYEMDEDGQILGVAEKTSNAYMWSEGGYDFQVIVPRYPGDFSMLVVNKTMRPIPKNIIPGQEIDTWLSFGREEYAYCVGVEVTTRTAVPGKVHLETEIVTKYVLLDENLDQVYPDYMDGKMIAAQDAFYEEYQTEILRIIQAAQAEWPFLTGE